MASHTEEMHPTYVGYLNSTLDALLLFEAVLEGHMSHVARRPHDRERSSLIRSGHVFVYEEQASGIKRWTDGVHWSPSRIQGNYLQYRELSQPFPPGEKKKAQKRKTGGNKSESVQHTVLNIPEMGHPVHGEEAAVLRRQLIGSLVESYQFKPDGKIKRTISYTRGNTTHHCVAYYHVEDVIGAKFMTPSRDPMFSSIWPRADLFSSGAWRTPLEEFLSPDPKARHPVHVAALCQSGHATPYQMQLFKRMHGDPSGPLSHFAVTHWLSQPIPGMPHQQYNGHYDSSQGGPSYHQANVGDSYSPSFQAQSLPYHAARQESPASNGDADLHSVGQLPMMAQPGSFSSLPANSYGSGHGFPAPMHHSHDGVDSYSSFSSQGTAWQEVMNPTTSRHASMGNLSAYDLSSTSRAAPRRRSEWQTDIHDGSLSSMTRPSVSASDIKEEDDAPAMLNRGTLPEHNSISAPMAQVIRPVSNQMFDPQWDFPQSQNPPNGSTGLDAATPRNPLDTPHLTGGVNLAQNSAYMAHFQPEYQVHDQLQQLPQPHQHHLTTQQLQPEQQQLHSQAPIDFDEQQQRQEGGFESDFTN